MTKLKFLGIIPARYASTRFPAKPLAMLGGKAVVQRVYEQVVASLDETYVATDDERIAEAVRAFGGKVVLIGVGKKNLDFNFTLLQKKELNVFGSRNALKKDFVELIDLVRSGKADLEKIITNLYPFQDAAKAFADFDQNGTQMLKVMIDFTAQG